MKRFTTSHCIKDCPGCGMTFSPDVKLCPVSVFDDWRPGIDLDDDQVYILNLRRENEKLRTLVGGEYGYLKALPEFYRPDVAWFKPVEEALGL